MPTTSIARAQFKLEFHNVHPGQNFVGIDSRRFTLAFRPLAIGVSYRLDLEVTEYLIISFDSTLTQDKIHRRSSIVEASYTILTSRTNPAEPQPFAALRSNRTNGIPMEIV